MASERKLTKNEKKRMKAKEKKVLSASSTSGEPQPAIKQSNVDDDLEGIEIEYVSANPLDSIKDLSILDQFKTIFEKFSTAEDLISSQQRDKIDDVKAEAIETKDDAEEENQQVKLSKKKKKLMSRLSVAELKQLVQRPDVVEAHDVTSSDPRLLVYLKAYRNTVPVPRHWCAKRKYLQGKRGVEKPPFQLPDFIAETGIAKIRDSVLEQEAQKKAKQKNRERMQPKTGKIDIDYQVLHDAFFKYQTKPKLTRHGDLYYEGKEFEVQLKQKTPGILSAELKAALGMTDTVPPPWLINMQRYGPPPSYPSLRIPGLNAPIPPGCQFGYQPGQWGKPPVDEYGRPLYGDVFGALNEDADAGADAVDRTTKWGELIVTEIEYESEDEEAQVDAGAEKLGRKGDRSEVGGLETPSTLDGMSSVNTGLQTPDIIDLRKRASGSETPDSMYTGGTRELYQVIQERAVTGGAAISGQLFGSDRTYVLPGKNDVQLSLQPDELEARLKDKDGLKDAYDSNLSDASEIEEGEDAKGKRKRRLDSSNIIKRYKDFKF